MSDQQQETEQPSSITVEDNCDPPRSSSSADVAETPSDNNTSSSSSVARPKLTGAEGDELLQYGIRRPIIHNVVARVSLDCPIELRKLVLHVRGVEFNPKRFPAAVVRLRNPRLTCLVFGSGKMIVTGAKTESDTHLGARKCARICQKLGFPVKFIEFRIINMIGLADLRFPIRLESVLLANEQMTQYEPEIFPGLVYRIVKPRLVLLIFVNGKIIITGAKSRSEIYNALTNIYPILHTYRKAV